jgi:hypothetical protein
MITVYDLAHDEKKEQFLVELSNICSKTDLSMLVGGDFNILRFSSEKINPSAPTDILTCSTGLLTHMVLERLNQL